jgi:hypothetical protein
MTAFPFFLYAEIHYRFKYFVSFLKRSEPEILVDAPHRIDPDRDLPVMILVKDADLYPITLRSALITLRYGKNSVYRESVSPGQPLPVNSHYWWNIASIGFRNELEHVFGDLSIDVEITYDIGGKRKVARNNNLRTSTKRSLHVYRSKTPLPSIPGWIAGDTHTHSSHTEDQVEFGSPIAASAQLAKAMGLSFFCVTDHSYDLDDRIGNYLVNDPSIPKWHRLQNDVDDVNGRDDLCTAVRGEEVSCENSDGRTVHLLLFGTRTYFYGSGDGAERWFTTACEHTIPSVLRSIGPMVAAYAGHPTEDVPFLQRLLLGRGEWTKQDVSLPGLHGIQILNGDDSDAFRNGIDVWRWLLLRGEKKYIAAGNDAHGNFNRFIQIGIPFISIKEKETQIFGKMKTALFSSPQESSILTALQRGYSVITNGPMFIIEVETDIGQIGKIGETVKGNSFIVKMRGISTEEFGKFSDVRIIAGTVGKKERTLIDKTGLAGPFELHTISDWIPVSPISYIRAEAYTVNGAGKDRNGFCITNPIWIETK